MTRRAQAVRPLRMSYAAAPALAAAILCGCASGRLMESSARSAADRLTALQGEIQQKINAENAYYDRILQNTRKDIQRTREDALNQELEQQALLFLAQPERTAVSGATLATYMQTVETGWTKSEQERQALLAEVSQQLTAGRSSSTPTPPRSPPCAIACAPSARRAAASSSRRSSSTSASRPSPASTSSRPRSEPRRTACRTEPIARATRCRRSMPR